MFTPYKNTNYFSTSLTSSGSLTISILEKADHPERKNVHGKAIKILTEILGHAKSNNSIDSVRSVDFVARMIFEGYERKMGFFGRLFDKFISFFKVTERQKIQNLVQEIYQQTKKNTLSEGQTELKKNPLDNVVPSSEKEDKSIGQFEENSQSEAVKLEAPEPPIATPNPSLEINEKSQNESPQSVRVYTGDLTDEQKNKLKAEYQGESELKISFKVDSKEIKSNVVEHNEIDSKIDFTIRLQDIFRSKAKVIVNAANTHLGGGGGIDGAIHSRGGSSYAQGHFNLSKKYHSQYVPGYAEIVESGLLKEKDGIDKVIVVAGPTGGPSLETEGQLYSCYYNSLLLAHQQNIPSLAFPSIATGIFGFDIDRAAAVSLKAVHDFINNHKETPLKTISIHFYHTEPKSNLEKYRTAATKIANDTAI